MNFDDPLHQGQTNARAVALWVQFVEQSEHAVEMFRRDSHAIIPHEEDGIAALPVLSRTFDLNAGIFLIAHELGCIIQEVLQHLDQSQTIAKDLGKVWIQMDGNAACDNSSLDQF